MAVQLTGLRYVSEGYAGFIAAANNATTQVSALGSALGVTQARGSGLGVMRTIAVGAFLAVGEAAVRAGASVLKFFSSSIEVAGNFEADMNHFQAIVGKTFDTSGKNLDQFRKLFIELGKELPVTTSEVVNAAIEMVKGGLDPATVAAGSLRQVILFAGAAHITLADAAKTAAKAVAAWVPLEADATKKTDFLTHATDFMTKAANASTVEINDLALGIQNAQGNARAAGATFDETATTVSLLAPAFRSGTEAGTALGTFMQRITGHSKPAIEAMKALGLWTDKVGSVFFDAQGKFVGMRKVVDLLTNATKDLTDREREEYLTKIFGQRGIKAATALMFAGVEGYDAMTRAIQRQNGVMESWAITQRGFNFALEQVKGSLEAFQIIVGGPLRDALTGLLLGTIKPGIDTLTTLAQAVLGDRDAFNDLSPTMQGVAEFITGSLIPGAEYAASIIGGAFSEAFKFVSDNARIFGLALETIAETIGGRVLIGAVFLLTDALMGLLNPFNLITGAIFALRLAWETDFLGIQEVVGPILDNIKKVINDVGVAFQTGGFQAALDTLTQDLIIFTGVDITPFVTALGAIGGAISAIGIAFETGGVGPAFSTFTEQLLSLTGIDISPLVTTFSDIATWLETNIPTALNTLKGQWDVIWPDLKEVAKDVGELLGHIAQALGEAGSAAATAEPTIADLADKGLKVIDAVLDGVNNHFDEFKGALIAIAGAAVIGLVIAKLGELAVALGAIATPIGALIIAIGALGFIWNTKVEQIGYETETVGQRAMRSINNIIAVVNDWASTIAHGVQGAIAQWEIFKFNTEVAFNDVRNSFNQLVAGFNSTVSSIGSSLNQLVSDIMSKAAEIVAEILSIPGRIIGVGAAIVANIWSGFESAWEGLMARARAKIQELMDLLPGSEPKDASSPLYGLGKHGAAIVKNLSMGIEDASPMFVTSLDSVFGAIDDLLKVIDISPEAFSGLEGMTAKLYDDFQSATDAAKKFAEQLQEMVLTNQISGFDQMIDKDRKSVV